MILKIQFYRYVKTAAVLDFRFNFGKKWKFLKSNNRNPWAKSLFFCFRGILEINFKADGKAARAGLREGDVITRVNGRDVKWARHSDVVDMLQVDRLEIEIVTVQVIT